ncbi:virulence factor Mce [Mycobacteroides abscessus subsp. bolletii]|uniref:MCE family protein n=1 Tax=Mycobacteroides abscessus TaxID=36809 RepID=UPI0009A882E0|nr:MCE family protein [Mycobacteroides abscessus]SKG72638.1 virulence factor Mce [Mycobacteroides abscessus subsp. bolletii]SKH10243.1 virulence factor Mce [Mycobacteroides abscessus subsp. bolletii]
MKAFQERNPAIIGAIGLAVAAAITVVAYNFNNLPGISSATTYSAYFEEAGGLTADAPVQVSGVRAGQVQSIALQPQGVLVTFRVDDDIRLGDRTEAAIKTISVLGNKILDVTPRGDGHLAAVIPLDRTTSPYQLPDAVGDLTATISGLKTDQLSESLRTLTQTLQDTPPHLRAAVDGVTRFSETIDKRDAQLRTLLQNASRATTVLGQRTTEIVDLVHNTNAVLAELQTQSDAIDHISGNLTTLAQQLHGFVTDNRSTLKPTLDRLNGVLAILDSRKTQLQQSIKGLGTYAMGLGESLSSGPFFKAYLANLFPGQFVQPFVDAAFSDLGLDPNVLSPSERTDPQVGQPGTPALPVPYPRTGQGGEPRMTLPDAITGNPGDAPCGPPGIALPGPGCYPYQPPLPAPPPGGPPPGPPAPPPASLAETPTPSPSPVFVPAPGEPTPPGAGS